MTRVLSIDIGGRAEAALTAIAGIMRDAARRQAA